MTTLSIFDSSFAVPIHRDGEWIAESGKSIDPAPNGNVLPDCKSKIKNRKSKIAGPQTDPQPNKKTIESVKSQIAPEIWVDKS